MHQQLLSPTEFYFFKADHFCSLFYNVNKMADVSKAPTLADHDYNLAGLREARDEEELEEMEAMEEEDWKMFRNHTPLPSPNPKKLTKESRLK